MTRFQRMIALWTPAPHLPTCLAVLLFNLKYLTKSVTLKFNFSKTFHKCFPLFERRALGVEISALIFQITKRVYIILRVNLFLLICSVALFALTNNAIHKVCESQSSYFLRRCFTLLKSFAVFPHPPPRLSSRQTLRMFEFFIRTSWFSQKEKKNEQLSIRLQHVVL